MQNCEGSALDTVHDIWNQSSSTRIRQQKLFPITINHTVNNSTTNNLTGMSRCRNIILNLRGWCPREKKRLGAWTVTQCHCEKEQSGLRDSNIWLYNDNWIQSRQNTSVSRSANPPIRQTRPDKTIRLKLYFYNHNQKKSSRGVGLCQVRF